MVLKIRKFNLSDALIIYFCYEFISFLVFNRAPVGPKVMFIMLFYFILLSAIDNGRIVFQKNLIAIGLFVGISVLGVLYQAAFHGTVIDSKGVASSVYAIKELISILLWFSLGYFYQRLNPSVVISLIGILCTLPFWKYINLEGLKFDYMPINLALNRFDIDHLHFSEGLVVLAFYSMHALRKSFSLVIAIFCYFTLLLFCMDGKGSFLFFILTFAIVFLYFDSRWRSIVLILIGLVFISELINFLGTILSIENTSTHARITFLIFALQNIDQFLLAGNIELIVKRFGSVGGYSHNILSLIQFYGLLPFFITIYIATKNCLAGLNHYDSESKFENSLLFYSVVSIVFAKSGSYFIFWLVIGIFSSHNFYAKGEENE